MMRFLSNVSAAMLLLTGLGACGDDDPGTHEDAATIGVLIARTGVMQPYYPSLAGMTGLAVSQVNAQGGVLGHDLTINEQDAPVEGAPAVSITAYETVKAAGVQAIIGTEEGPGSIAIAERAGVDKIVHIAPVVATPAYSTVNDDDYAYRMISNEQELVRVPAAWLYEQGHRRLALIFIDGNTTPSLAFGQEFTAAGGTVVSTEGYSYDPAHPEAFDVAPILQRTFAAEPDVIWLFAVGQDGILILRAWQQADFSGQWLLGPSLASTAVPPAIGVAKAAGIQAFAFATSSPENVTTIATQFREVNGFDVDPASATLVLPRYEATLLMALAIERAGEYDGEKIRDALRDVANPPGEQVTAVDLPHALELVRAGVDIDYVGLQSPIDFDERGDVTLNTAILEFDANGALLVEPSYAPYQAQ